MGGATQRTGPTTAVASHAVIAVAGGGGIAPAIINVGAGSMCRRTMLRTRAMTAPADSTLLLAAAHRVRLAATARVGRPPTGALQALLVAMRPRHVVLDKE